MATLFERDKSIAKYIMIEELFEGKDVVNSDGKLSFWGIFFNNLWAGVIGVFTDENIVMMIIKYLLPHGIFEIHL